MSKCKIFTRSNTVIELSVFNQLASVRWELVFNADGYDRMTYATLAYKAVFGKTAAVVHRRAKQIHLKTF